MRLLPAQAAHCRSKVTHPTPTVPPQDRWEAPHTGLPHASDEGEVVHCTWHLGGS